MVRVYAFDVDETLEVSNGPVTLAMMEELRQQGHIVGICGNWGLFCAAVPDWHMRVGFVNCMPSVFHPDHGQWNLAKVWFMQHFAQYVRADEYVMVGNIRGQKNSLGHVCGSDDDKFAQMAGWRFIKEDDFAKGAR